MSIAYTTTNTYLRVVRAPLDAALGTLPSNRSGVTSARLAIDRADAAIRRTVGTFLRDSALMQDADLREAAAQERERARDLRDAADRQAQRADTRLERRQDDADSKRAQADSRAKVRRDVASRERAAKVDAVGAVQQKRAAASRRAASEREEKLDREEPKARLASLEAKSDALDDRAEALAAADEARRLGRAAGHAKAQRKNAAK